MGRRERPEAATASSSGTTSRATRFGLLVLAVAALDVALVLVYPGGASLAPAGFVVRLAIYVAWGLAATRTPVHLLTTPLLGLLATLLVFALSDAVVVFAGLATRRGPVPIGALAVAGYAIPLGGSLAGGLAALLRPRARAAPRQQVDG